MDRNQRRAIDSVGSYKKSFILDYDIGTYMPNSNRYISSFCEDNKANLWIGIYDGGIVIKDQHDAFQTIQHHSDDPFSLNSNLVKCLYTGRSGVLWVGGEGLGLDKLDLYKKPFFHYQHESDNPASLSFNTIMSFAEDPMGRMWIGTKEGINVFYPQQNRFDYYENQTSTLDPLITDKIWSLYADEEDGIMWIGGHYGLIAANLKTKSGDGEIKWIDGDLSRQFKHIPFIDPNLDPEKHQVRVILKDRSGYLWVGTYNGLYMLDNQGSNIGILQHFQHDPLDSLSISGNIVISIKEDKQGDIWIGTRDAGLNRLVKDPETTTVHFERFMQIQLITILLVITKLLVFMKIIMETYG